MKVFLALLQRRMPRLYQTVRSLQSQADREGQAERGPVGLFGDWFRQFFQTWLPAVDVLNLVDAYLSEGLKILLRVGLAWLKILRRQLRHAGSCEEFEMTLRNWVIGAATPADVAPYRWADLIDAAFHLRGVSKSDIEAGLCSIPADGTGLPVLASGTLDASAARAPWFAPSMSGWLAQLLCTEERAVVSSGNGSAGSPGVASDVPDHLTIGQLLAMPIELYSPPTAGGDDGASGARASASNAAVSSATAVRLSAGLQASLSSPWASCLSTVVARSLLTSAMIEHPLLARLARAAQPAASPHHALASHRIAHTASAPSAAHMLHMQDAVRRSSSSAFSATSASKLLALPAPICTANHRASAALHALLPSSVAALHWCSLYSTARHALGLEHLAAQCPGVAPLLIVLQLASPLPEGAPVTVGVFSARGLPAFKPGEVTRLPFSAQDMLLKLGSGITVYGPHASQRQGAQPWHTSMICAATKSGLLVGGGSDGAASASATSASTASAGSFAMLIPHTLRSVQISQAWLHDLNVPVPGGLAGSSMTLELLGLQAVGFINSRGELAHAPGQGSAANAALEQATHEDTLYMQACT